MAIDPFGFDGTLVGGVDVATFGTSPESFGDIGGAAGIGSLDLMGPQFIDSFGDIGGAAGPFSLAPLAPVSVDPFGGFAGVASESFGGSPGIASLANLPGGQVDPFGGFQGAAGGEEYFVDTDSGSVVDSAGNQVLGPAEFERLASALESFGDVGGAAGDRGLAGGVGIGGASPGDQRDQGDEGWFRKLAGLAEEFPGVTKVLASLGLGGLGLAISQAIVGGGSRLNLPAAPPPPATRTASQSALERVFGPGAVPGLAGPGGTGGPVNLAATFQPGASGLADFESALRSGFGAQRNLADILLSTSARELQAGAEQAPFERAIRAAALGEIPGLLQPTANLGPTLETGQLASRNLADILTRRPGLGTTLTDPVQQALERMILNAIAARPGAGQPPTMLDDQIRAGLEAQVQRALAGDLPTPELERQFREEEARLRNQLARTLGPGWETSTPGLDAMQRLRESQQIRTQEFQRQTIAAFAPQEAARREFALRFPEEQFRSVTALAPQEAQRRQFGIQEPLRQFQTNLAALAPLEFDRARFAEDVRQRGLTERRDLSGFGRTGPATLTATLPSIVPSTGALLGLGESEDDRRAQINLQNRAAIAAFDAEQRQREALAEGVGDIFGTAAGRVL